MAGKLCPPRHVLFSPGHSVLLGGNRTLSPLPSGRHIHFLSSSRMFCPPRWQDFLTAVDLVLHSRQECCSLAESWDAWPADIYIGRQYNICWADPKGGSPGQRLVTDHYTRPTKSPANRSKQLATHIQIYRNTTQTSRTSDSRIQLGYIVGHTKGAVHCSQYITVSNKDLH